MTNTEQVIKAINNLPDGHKLFIQTGEGSAFAPVPYTNELKALVRELEAVKAEVEDWERTFEMQHDAERRGVELWKDEKPEE